jgi:hypothetical protein
MVSDDHAKRGGVKPVYIALAIAAFGIVAMLVVDHGPGSRPHVQSADIAKHQTTGEAARSAGAGVKPTEPRSRLEPEPPMPRPAEPSKPAPD